MFKQYLSKVFRLNSLRIDPMKALKSKALKSKKEKNNKISNYCYNDILYSIMMLFVVFSLEFFIWGLIFIVSIDPRSSLLLSNNFISSSLIMILLFNISIFIPTFISSKRGAKYLNYVVSYEDIKEYVKSFEKNEQKLVISKIVSLLNNESLDLYSFDCHKKYLNDDKQVMDSSLSDKQENIVKCIQESIEQDEKNIILNKEKVH